MTRTLPEHYDPDHVEQHVKHHWTNVDAYQQAVKATADGEPFYFVDGPPNTSGQMHCGTAWGKVLKDALLRYYRMQGRAVFDRPGYDTHGLPVERRVEAELGVESKQDVAEYGVEQFVADCREFVERQRESMDEEFADLGVWMDWDDPYQTMDTDYMEVVWTAFAQLHDRGLLSRERRVVNSCPDCETSVAETRLGYETRESTAAYVGFPLREREGSLLTWTTTPWTVTGNQFVALDREATYAAVETPEGLLYLARDCVEAALEALGVESYSVRDHYRGEELLGWQYHNPLADSLPEDAPSRDGVVTDASYVELDRTGLVHSAPGFGQEDFERGRELGVPAYVPLDEAGVFTAADSQFSGLGVTELRREVLSALEQAGALFGSHQHEHEYPRCPRCESEVLYRAADQWLLSVTDFKDDLLDAVGETTWYPDGARENRFRPMVEDAPDWNVSRQRYWGTPVPVWVCEACGQDVVVSDATELAELADLAAPPDDLHRPTVDSVTVDCPACGGAAHREDDVLDVWFDSSVASWATDRTSPPQRPDAWPADLVVEGHDQTRGWFLMQLYMGVLFGDGPPYEEVLMHGFATLDGKAMSKSSGHVLRPSEVVEEYGRDALRGHLLSHNPSKDVSLDSEMDGVATVADRLDVVWNVYRFALLYMNLDGQSPTCGVETTPAQRRPLDDWVLSRLQATVETVEKAMENRRTDRALDAVLEFLVEDVSHDYVSAVRDRVWDGSTAAYDTLGTVLQEGTRLLAPFTPFLAEELYQALGGDAETVHATGFPAVEDRRNRSLERRFQRMNALREATATARQHAERKRRWPVVEVVVETDDETMAEAVRCHRNLLEDRLNAQTVLVTRSYDRTVETPEPRMEALGPAFGEDAPSVAAALRSHQVTEFPAEVSVDGTTETVTAEMVAVRAETPDAVEAVDFEYGTVYVDTTMTTGLKREGIYRDLRRHAQELRDRLDVGMDEPVVLAVDGDDTLVEEAVETYRDELAAETRASELVTDTEEVEASTTLSVEGATVSVGVGRLP